MVFLNVVSFDGFSVNTESIYCVFGIVSLWEVY